MGRKTTAGTRKPVPAVEPRYGGMNDWDWTDTDRKLANWFTRAAGSSPSWVTSVAAAAAAAAAAHVRVLDIAGLIVIYLCLLSVGLAEVWTCRCCRRKILTRKAHRFPRAYLLHYSCTHHDHFILAFDPQTLSKHTGAQDKIVSSVLTGLRTAGTARVATCEGSVSVDRAFQRRDAPGSAGHWRDKARPPGDTRCAPENVDCHSSSHHNHGGEVAMRAGLVPSARFKIDTYQRFDRRDDMMARLYPPGWESNPDFPYSDSGLLNWHALHKRAASVHPADALGETTACHACEHNQSKSSEPMQGEARRDVAEAAAARTIKTTAPMTASRHGIKIHGKTRPYIRIDIQKTFSDPTHDAKLSKRRNVVEVEGEGEGEARPGEKKSSIRSPLPMCSACRRCACATE
ncbi:hypothetical protein CPLU01_06779 [Colletotrichum plurivorum]|uniref:Uncharacterized protein n=1 Tax=Colletotrichum plurivorum TaxID=2175906 RepID=A0A8H6KHW4_9PEZI|nr:hypothetical protein CPLU01_06779 [Colletotrichum plurivorum]